MNKITVVAILILLLCPSLSKADKVNENMDWVIYLAVGPYEAASLIWYQKQDYDITQYSYPLYVGYIYTKDSKKIEWHADVEFAKVSINNFAVHRARQLMFLWGYPGGNNEIVPGSKKTAWNLSDPEFFDAAVRLIRTDSDLVPIRYERNVPLNKTWKPLFRKEVRIIGDIMKSCTDYDSCAPVQTADDKLDWRDFVPTNWDPTNNTNPMILHKNWKKDQE
jgi:hypothetical protein